MAKKIYSAPMMVAHLELSESECVCIQVGGSTDEILTKERNDEVMPEEQNAQSYSLW